MTPTTSPVPRRRWSREPRMTPDVPRLLRVRRLPPAQSPETLAGRRRLLLGVQHAVARREFAAPRRPPRRPRACDSPRRLECPAVTTGMRPRSASGPRSRRPDLPSRPPRSRPGRRDRRARGTAVAKSSDPTRTSSKRGPDSGRMLRSQSPSPRRRGCKLRQVLGNCATYLRILLRLRIRRLRSEVLVGVHSDAFLEVTSDRSRPTLRVPAGPVVPTRFSHAAKG